MHLNFTNTTETLSFIQTNSVTLYISYVIASLIVISNLPVVISSGLILKKGCYQIDEPRLNLLSLCVIGRPVGTIAFVVKSNHRGQKPKCTYILLGNVSLADTILGTSIIYGISHDIKTESPICTTLMGFLVCPAMVSIFSVGFIAIDRYIYIVHGLHYKMWINTCRVRIGIALTWFIGITLSFLPVTGWINKNPPINEYTGHCYYINVFPEELILLNSFLSVIPIIVVVILYSIILVKALQTVKMINGTNKVNDIDLKSSNEKPKLRMYRGTVVNKNIDKHKDSDVRLKRSASLDLGKNIELKDNSKSRSIEDITNSNFNNSKTQKSTASINKTASNVSVNTIESAVSLDMTNNNVKPKICERITKSIKSVKVRPKEPNKWRAITVVMLTTASFTVTWMPFFIMVVFYVFCPDKSTNEQCIHYQYLVSSPLCILGFFNSLLNPIIYAWWHKGFKRTVRTYYRRLFHRCIQSC